MTSVLLRGGVHIAAELLLRLGALIRAKFRKKGFLDLLITRRIHHN